jgi:hypothetical protein
MKSKGVFKRTFVFAYYNSLVPGILLIFDFNIEKYSIDKSSTKNRA